MGRGVAFSMHAVAFQEARLGEVPIRELGLRIAGTRLEPLVAEVRRELSAWLPRLEPHFYLSTEWGVPFETISVAIPFYLARPELAELHAEETGMIEGESAEDILRYLRHEVGHAVNYAYCLYDRTEWVQKFGAITQPYVEEYRPKPWSTRFVRHLPGWYAQKHPDEDWAETFAVWLTPGRDWRAEYAAWPEARSKLELCEQVIGALHETPPTVTNTELDEDVGEIDVAAQDLYADPAAPELPPGLDGALRAIFDELAPDGAARAADRLIATHARDVARAVFTWTGHFPETTRVVLRHLAARAAALGLTYPESRAPQALVGLTALVTSLAMNHVHRGRYLP
jgi:hypothetical protein